jgi:hypothetical protein
MKNPIPGAPSFWLSYILVTTFASQPRKPHRSVVP